ncbi:MAG: anaerobic carbon-monoxide dehydrogenase catalytic subunit [Candidatus Hydrogenedentes bacterium]|nr:anaerobic carbon-monoxide dehydrogenase catalytic subunit [Candidatus Hydrogenedentota bacterium]
MPVPGSHQRSSDPAACRMLELAAQNALKLAYDRYDAMQPLCGYGQLGICCQNCNMGPCRINPFGDGPQTGICGASPAVIAARNLARKSAVGSAAHSDHGRGIAQMLLQTARGKTPGYRIKGPAKLRKLAEEWGIPTAGATTEQLAEKVALAALEDFGRQDGVLRFVSRAPQKVRARWEKAGVAPRGIDREIVGTLHSTNMGASNEPHHLILNCVRAGLADGWGGSMIATELSDILLGEPAPLVSEANLGVLKRDYVNILVHGHEPVLSDALVVASQSDEVLDACRDAGAQGLQLAGICCTANEVLMRHGVPIAGNLLHQEFALVTGAVEMMVVDIQCIFPALRDLAKKYHTLMVSTSPKAHFEGFQHIEFDDSRAIESAKQILLAGVANYVNRDKSKVHIPTEKSPLVAGFTTEGVFDHLGGRYRPSYRPLNNAISDGRIRGVVAVVGCNTVKIKQDEAHLALVKELLRHDVLVVQTGCSAIACGKAGLLTPEAADLYAGNGLKEVCDAVGLPPCLHMGSCVDISRILTACIEICREGGLGDDFADLPVAGAAPEWMSDKAIAIGFYVVGSGVYTVVGDPLPVMGSPVVADYLTNGIEKDFGGKFAFEKDPIQAARLIIKHIDSKREALHLSPMMFEPRPVESLGKPLVDDSARAAVG